MTDLRVPFIDTLIELAAKDDKIVLIVMDVGFKHADRFKEKYPDRYFNLGITECSSMLTAAGLALSGYKVWVYSMINFVLFRPFEMLRNGVCLHDANVKLIGVSGSAAYKFLGFSHNKLFDDEDFSHLNGLPNITTYGPKDEEGVKEAVLTEYNSKHPAYIRL